MSRLNRRPIVRPGAWLAAIAATFVLLCLPSLGRENATIDEGRNLYVGYRLLTARDLSLAVGHPPLMSALNALPLYSRPIRLAVGGTSADSRIDRVWLQYQDAFDTWYRMGNDADRALRLGRLVSVACAVTAILATWWLGALAGGRRRGLVAAGLLACLPMFLAHGRIVREDIGVTAALAWTLVAVLRWRNRPRPGRALLAGAAFGIALLMKQSAVFLAPVILWALVSRTRRGAWKPVGLWVLAGWVVVVAGYLGQGMSLPHPLDRDEPGRGVPILAHRIADAVASWTPLPAEYVNSARFFVMTEREESHAEEAAGRIPTPVRAFWVFVMKSPEGFLCLLVLAMWRPVRLRGTERYLAAACACLVLGVGGMHGGSRHLLPVLPFVCALAARGVTRPASRPRRRLGWIFAALHGLAGVAAAAHPVPYANWLVGGSGQAYRWMSGSDLDWGQDLKPLARYVDRTKADDVLLAYNGLASPAYYGLRFQNAGTTTMALRGWAHRIGADHPQRELLAVSGQYVSQQYQALGKRAWLLTHPPEEVIGRTIFVYDITRDADMHIHLAEGYLARGETDEFRRESRRLSAILPDEPAPHGVLAEMCARYGNAELGKEETRLARSPRRPK